jgi:hypothetical protein
MDDQAKLKDVRDRLRDLNTKAYYLLIALTVAYRKPTPSLKWALALTAFVAVVPLQDFFRSRSWVMSWLESIRWQKVAFLWAAFGFTLCWISQAS